MRTIFYHAMMVISLVYGIIIRYPVLFFLNKEKKYTYAGKIAKSWGRVMLWASGSKAEVIYNDSKDEMDILCAENIPVLLISNHQSNLDIPVLLAKSPKQFSFIAKKEMKHWPIIGSWMKAFDCIFLDRKNAKQGMKDMKQAIEKIKNGRSYLIFPEGSRTLTGNILEFKKGSFKLATDTDVNVIPVTIVGTYEVQNRKSLKVKANKNIKMIIDKPINTEQLTREEKKNLNNTVHDIIVNNYNKYK